MVAKSESHRIKTGVKNVCVRWQNRVETYGELCHLLPDYDTITVVLIGLGVVGVRRSLVALAAGGGSRTARLLDRGLGFLAPGMIMVFGLLMAWATWIRISAGI